MTKSFTKLSLIALFCFAAISGASAQTVLVNYDFASAVAGTPCTATPLTTATGVTSTFTTGGTGGGTCTTPAGTAVGAPPAFVANGLNQSVSLTSFAAGSTNFFQFQLSGVTSYQDYMLFFQARRSPSGPVNLAVQYSTDGVTFTTFQTVAPGNDIFVAFTIDLSTVAAIEGQPTVYFRLLGTGGTGSTGTLRIDNFQVQAVAPTAAQATLAGRVTTANGAGIRNAIVSISGGDLPETRYSRTSSFGYYGFEDLASGETYVVTVNSKQYTFTVPTRVVQVNDSIDGVDFVAEQ